MSNAKPEFKDKIASILQQVFDGFAEHTRKQLLASHCLADRKEREARVDAVIELSAEITRIAAVSIQATGLYRQPIEAIILGDWDGAAEYLSMLTFADEHEETRKRLAPLWARFREILECAVIAARARQRPSSITQ